MILIENNIGTKYIILGNKTRSNHGILVISNNKNNNNNNKD